jgi:uncharacterized protein YggU (UPF0235/DUF167 family)
MLGCRGKSLNNLKRFAMSVSEHVVIGVSVTPGGRRADVIGWSGDELRIRLLARPVGLQADEALRRFLAERLDIPRSAAEIIAGAASRRNVCA